MLEHFIASLPPEIISLLELIGIIVISCGAVKAFYYYIHSFFTKKRYPIRIELANALALGLEFKMGSEILRTVVVREWKEIGIVAGIIALRAALTFLLHWEIKQEEKSSGHEE